ncbi:TraB/GumN family protein [Massilia sp. GCM10023247]|uniref:TraB/GumN family protein n=1 Tax=Massilia sp. GCM10023247 TaxID=3252643 RepID=UPI0036109F30
MDSTAVFSRLRPEAVPRPHHRLPRCLARSIEASHAMATAGLPPACATVCSPRLSVLSALVLALGMLAPAGPAAGAPLAAADETAQYAVSQHGAVGPEPVAARHHGGLYRISGRGGVAYLFGTIHVGDRSFYPLAPEAERALAEADHVVVELDPRGERAFRHALARHGRYPDGDDIGRHVSADTLVRLRAALHAEGVSLASMAQSKPWLIANLLLSIQLDREGFRRSEGVEQRLLAQAERHGARIVPLESAELQLGLFDSMSEVEAERYLRDTLAGLADGSTLQRARRTIEAWRTGDTAALASLLADATAGNSETAEFTRRKLLGRRNAEMAAQIDTLLEQGGVFFVGVGLLHLLGDDGLPQLLAQRGYLIERVY